MQTEARVSVAEATLRDLKTAFDQVRPQLAITSFLGSSAGAIIVGVVVWWVTKK